jgi:hypothetical protein
MEERTSRGFEATRGKKEIGSRPKRRKNRSKRRFDI